MQYTVIIQIDVKIKITTMKRLVFMENNIIIIGAGLAGLSAALTIADRGQHCFLVSEYPSERAQSVLAEGGISAELAENREDILAHWQDTLEEGRNLADPNAVWEMVKESPNILKKLIDIGVPFQRSQDILTLRKMGGHSKERTLFAGNSTGKVIMTALIDEVRKKESLGLIQRFSHYTFEKLILEKEICQGCVIKDSYTDKRVQLHGLVILASGGMSGLFLGHATGTKQNDGRVTAEVFKEGVELGNLEFIQYHPTTVKISGKMLLVSESARSVGGRFFIQKNEKPWYFMEDIYGVGGNLLARDLTSQNIWKVSHELNCKLPVYLDMTKVEEGIWKNQMASLKEECEYYLNINPKTTPIPIEPAIHYCMGGILVDKVHHTNKKFLYAAGECACQYHGANRLGGNSMLGALYGGYQAAKTALAELSNFFTFNQEIVCVEANDKLDENFDRKIAEALWNCMGIIRNERDLKKGLEELQTLYFVTKSNKLLLGIAMIKSALERKESRGAHNREDYPNIDKEYQKTTVAYIEGEEVRIRFQKIPNYNGGIYGN